MTSYILTFSCCILVLVQPGAASLYLEMTLSEVVPGITSSLTVNCSISSSDSVNVISIILSKAGVQMKGAPAMEFPELASVDIFSPNQPRMLNKTPATLSSYIGLGLDETNFLALHWVFPSDLESGMYRCQAYGADPPGHPKEFAQTSHVMGKPSFSQLLETTTLLKVQLENQTEEQSEIRRELENQDKKLHELRTNLERQEKKQAQLVSAMFEKSSEYNGHYYLLSKQEYGNIDAAEAVCEHHGGYLAEIDNSDEHELSRISVISFPTTYSQYMLGQQMKLRRESGDFASVGRD